jgi:hypothetical protein
MGVFRDEHVDIRLGDGRFRDSCVLQRFVKCGLQKLRVGAEFLDYGEALEIYFCIRCPEKTENELLHKQLGVKTANQALKKRPGWMAASFKAGWDSSTSLSLSATES